MWGNSDCSFVRAEVDKIRKVCVAQLKCISDKRTEAREKRIKELIKSRWFFRIKTREQAIKRIDTSEDENGDYKYWYYGDQKTCEELIHACNTSGDGWIQLSIQNCKFIKESEQEQEERKNGNT